MRIVYLHSTKPELRFCSSSNLAHAVLQICNGKDLWKWSQLEIRLCVFCWLTIPQKQFIITSVRSRKARYSVTDVYITEVTVTLMSYEGIPFFLWYFKPGLIHCPLFTTTSLWTVLLIQSSLLPHCYRISYWCNDHSILEWMNEC